MNRISLYFLIVTLGIVGILFQGCYKSDCQRKGVSYYFDAENGTDTNNGLSEKTAWKNIDKIREIQLNPGDSLLLRRGSVFEGIIEICAQGESENRIVIDAYGTGSKPCIKAPDNSLYTICIRNSDYITLQNLEVVNTGLERKPTRTGVKVMCENYGTSNNIILNSLYIHDVNGSLVKAEGGGSGILIDSRWDKDSMVSVFDSLTIENCVIRRCERNAIIWNAPWSRKNWHLSTNTVVRRNLIEEVPGDGIVPIGCDGALIEYNLMRNCTALLPDSEAAAGIWPWSCDNTIIQFNEVSDHKAPWDAQGFDSDYNCTNTTIQYNYSHNNDGGFILICNSGEGGNASGDNIGNIGSIIRYNLSINDAIRQRKTRVGTFSPTIHIAGPCKNTLIEHNILHVGEKPSNKVDRKVVTSDSWGGYADSTTFKNNLFYVQQPSAFNLTQSTNNHFIGNYYIGEFSNKPLDAQGHNLPLDNNSIIKNDKEGSVIWASMFRDEKVGDGTAVIKVVNKDAIQTFFNELESE